MQVHLLVDLLDEEEGPGLGAGPGVFWRTLNSLPSLRACWWTACSMPLSICLLSAFLLLSAFTSLAFLGAM